MWNEYEITYRKAFELKSDDFNDKSSIRENIARIRREMKSLGDVNINAIEEFKEINERYQFMKGQHDDLMEARENLLKIIDELEVGMRKQFKEKLKKLRLNSIMYLKNFSEVEKVLLNLRKPMIFLMQELTLFPSHRERSFRI